MQTLKQHEMRMALESHKFTDINARVGARRWGGDPPKSKTTSGESRQKNTCYLQVKGGKRGRNHLCKVDTFLTSKKTTRWQTYAICHPYEGPNHVCYFPVHPKVKCLQVTYLSKWYPSAKKNQALLNRFQMPTVRCLFLVRIQVGGGKPIE